MKNSITIIRICIVAIQFLFFFQLTAQNNTLILDGAFIFLNGGTSATPIYLVVNQNNTSGITRASGGHIVSEGQFNLVKWNCGTGTGNYIYPFGYSMTDYIPFTFNKTTAGSSDIEISTWATTLGNMPHPAANNVAAVCYMNGNGDSLNSVIDRFWDIKSSAGVTADLTFSYRGAENTIGNYGGFPNSNFKAQHWNGTQWDPQMGNGNAGVTSGIGTVGTVGGQTTFSPWILSSVLGMIPIELLKFSAQCNDKQVIVKWTTASEQNNDFFTIERSTDALNYQPLGLVNGIGNSSFTRNYSFMDIEPLNETSYYRLKQTDFDGMTRTFSAASVSCSENSNFSVTINPNLISDGNILVSINGAENKNVNVEITDIFGRTFYSRSINDKSGSYILNTNLQLGSGVYIISASTTENVFTKKIVVVR
ncbi:MAG: T9SS type A sorting domain-containing protein [Bacteroidota bacterium]